MDKLRRRVLVCGGERHLARLLQVNLERQGYEVETCARGDEAVAELMSGHFKIAVLAGDLADMSSDELRSVIETSEPLSEIKVLNVPRP